MHSFCRLHWCVGALVGKISPARQRGCEASGRAWRQPCSPPAVATGRSRAQSFHRTEGLCEQRREEVVADLNRLL